MQLLKLRHDIVVLCSNMLPGRNASDFSESFWCHILLHEAFKIDGVNNVGLFTLKSSCRESSPLVCTKLWADVWPVPVIDVLPPTVHLDLPRFVSSVIIHTVTTDPKRKTDTVVSVWHILHVWQCFDCFLWTKRYITFVPKWLLLFVKMCICAGTSFDVEKSAREPDSVEMKEKSSISWKVLGASWRGLCSWLQALPNSYWHSYQISSRRMLVPAIKQWLQKL